MLAITDFDRVTGPFKYVRAKFNFSCKIDFSQRLSRINNIGTWEHLANVCTRHLPNSDTCHPITPDTYQQSSPNSHNQCLNSSVSNCKWFCTVTQNRGVIARTTNLRDAQRPLGGGNKNNRQAIIPMTDRRAGDPHSLPKGWGSGSMWWWDWWDVNQMREKCARQQPVCKGIKITVFGLSSVKIQYLV